MAALVGIGFWAFAWAHDAGLSTPLRVAQADVTVKVTKTPHGRVVKKVITRRFDRPVVKRVVVVRNRSLPPHRHVVVVKKRIYC